MTKRAFQYLFGPVPSRRFGRSLGVDLTPFKTCTLDCVFCQLGHTTVKTLERREYAPIGAVTEEIAAWIHNAGNADYITLAGSGEPTLHSRFGEVIDFIHERSSIPVALLTNGTTLSLPEVRAAARRADVIKITLSAWDEKSFKRLHRPCAGLTFRQLIQGERQLRDEFRGPVWMEVFLVGGVNSSPAQAQRIANEARRIKPDRIQLNTCVRPPAEEFAVAVSGKRMAEFARLFTPPGEVVAAFHAAGSAAVKVNTKAIEDMLRRRPCTMTDIAGAFGMHLNEVSKYVGELVHAGRIRAQRRNGGIYYLADLRKEPDDANV